MAKYSNNYCLQDAVVTDIQGEGPDKIAVTCHDNDVGVEVKALFHYDQIEHILSTKALDAYRELESSKGSCF